MGLFDSLDQLGQPAQSPLTALLLGGAGALEKYANPTDKPTSPWAALGAAAGGMGQGLQQQREQAVQGLYRSMQTQQMAVANMRSQAQLAQIARARPDLFQGGAFAGLGGSLGGSAGGGAAAPAAGSGTAAEHAFTTPVPGSGSLTGPAPAPPAGASGTALPPEHGGNSPIFGFRTGMPDADFATILLDPDMKAAATKIVENQYPGPTDMKRMIAERNGYPQGSPEWTALDAKITEAEKPVALRPKAFAWDPVAKKYTFLPSAGDGQQIVGQPGGELRLENLPGSIPAKKEIIRGEQEAQPTLTGFGGTKRNTGDGPPPAAGAPPASSGSPELDALGPLETTPGGPQVSPKGAIGKYQIMPATGARYGVKNPNDLFDEQTNTRVAKAYMADLTKTFVNPDGSPDMPRVFAAYNAGDGAVKLWGKNFWSQLSKQPETAAYVAHALQNFHGARAASAAPPPAPGPAPAAPPAPAPAGTSTPTTAASVGKPSPQAAEIQAHTKSIQDEVDQYKGQELYPEGSLTTGPVAPDIQKRAFDENAKLQDQKTINNSTLTNVRQIRDVYQEGVNLGFGATWMSKWTGLMEKLGYKDLIPPDLQAGQVQRILKSAAQMAAGEGARGTGSEKWLENAKNFTPGPDLTDSAFLHLLDSIEGNARYNNDYAVGHDHFVNKFHNDLGFRSQWDANHQPINYYDELQKIAHPAPERSNVGTVLTDAAQAVQKKFDDLGMGAKLAEVVRHGVTRETIAQMLEKHPEITPDDVTKIKPFGSPGDPGFAELGKGKPFWDTNRQVVRFKP